MCQWVRSCFSSDVLTPPRPCARIHTYVASRTLNANSLKAWKLFHVLSLRYCSLILGTKFNGFAKMVWVLTFGWTDPAHWVLLEWGLGLRIDFQPNPTVTVNCTTKQRGQSWYTSPLKGSPYVHWVPRSQCGRAGGYQRTLTSANSSLQLPAGCCYAPPFPGFVRSVEQLGCGLRRAWGILHDHADSNGWGVAACLQTSWNTWRPFNSYRNAWASFEDCMLWKPPVKRFFSHWLPFMHVVKISFLIY